MQPGFTMEPHFAARLVPASPEDERRFETAKRVSEMNLEAYRKYMQPWVKSMVTPQMAEMMHNSHPLRVQYDAFSSEKATAAAVVVAPSANDLFIFPLRDACSAKDTRDGTSLHGPEKSRPRRWKLARR